MKDLVMTLPISALEVHDTAAAHINLFLLEHASQDAKAVLPPINGQGNTDWLITDGIGASCVFDIPLPPREWVVWRSLNPLPYDSEWWADQRAIPYIQQIDARPEMQAEFKRPAPIITSNPSPRAPTEPRSIGALALPTGETHDQTHP